MRTWEGEAKEPIRQGVGVPRTRDGVCARVCATGAGPRPRAGGGRWIKGHPGGRGPGQQPAPRALSALRCPTRFQPAGASSGPRAARPAERSRTYTT